MKTCGFLLQYKDTYLICRSTQSRNVWGIPKGKREKGESEIEAAIRELKEETNITLTIEDIHNSYEPFLIYDTSKKTVVVFKVELENKPDDIKCIAYINGTETPEMDKYAWVTKQEALEMVHNHMRRIFQEIK